MDGNVGLLAELSDYVAEELIRFIQNFFGEYYGIRTRAYDWHLSVLSLTHKKGDLGLFPRLQKLSILSVWCERLKCKNIELNRRYNHCFLPGENTIDKVLKMC